VEVKDADPHPPIPAVGRDAAQGGLGLVLVARLSGSHGWAIDENDCKTVWACVEYQPVTAASTLPAPRAPLGANDPGPGGPARPPQLVIDVGGDTA
jgi:hypothetical protein